MPKNPAINQSKTQSLVTPPPVVVILGHIDHGKSTLLHKIREAKAPKEAGDITQHIGAYQALVSQKTGKKGQKANQLITFIDTPGHKAFDTVRTHGTSIADVAIVVVAADEGVEAQTKEVLALVQAAKLPYIIAVNKIDKPGANVQKIKQDLGQFNVYIEEWGGEVPLVEVSALKGTGIDQLLEMILLVYAMQERTVRVDGHAQGVVLTAGIDPKSGRYATLLVEEGTLNIRDTIYIKRNENRIRIMTDATGAPITQAGPSTPVFIRGIKEIPSPGDRFSTDKTATTTVTAAIATDAAAVSAEQSAVVGPARDPFAKETHKFVVIIKADGQSSLDAIKKSLDEIKIQDFKIIHLGIGNITKSDVELAMVRGALIFGFDVVIDPQAAGMIKQRLIFVKTFTIIYDLIDAVTKVVREGLVAKIIREDVGRLRVLKVFMQKRGSMIVGGKVEEGKISKGAKVEVVRKGPASGADAAEGATGQVVVGTGIIKELQQGKAEVKEVGKGFECGITFQGEPIIQENDVLRAYVERSELPEL